MSEAAARAEVTVGAWSVQVGRRPWSLRMRPLGGGPGLDEAPHAQGLIGPAGFQTPAEGRRRRWRSGPARQRPGPHNEDPPVLDDWWAATAVLDDEVGTGAYRAVVATTHPGGATLEVTVAAAPHEALSVRVVVAGVSDIEAVGQAFVAEPAERWMGFGERSDAVVRRDGVVEAYVGEGPYQPDEYEVLVELFPPWALRQRADAAYYPVPWVLSTRGVGLLVDNDEVSHTRLRPGPDERWSVEVEADELRYRVFPGPSPLEALGRFTAATGRQPAPGPAWWFGPWVQTGHANHVPLAEEAAVIAAVQSAGGAVSAAETHCRYLPLGEHRGHEAHEAARTEHFHGAGLATLSYLNPFVGVEFADAFEAARVVGALQRRSDGEPYTFRAYAGGRNPPEAEEAQYDFTAPAAAAVWGEVAAALVDAGHDGWMEDFGEYTPFDTIGADGTPGAALHNRYPTDYHRVAAGVADELGRRRGRPLARFVRSGWTGTAPWAPIVWGGDPTTGWGFDGLASALRQALSIGTSGVAVWGSDTGGFFSSTQQLDVELLVRWIQFSAFCPVLRTKSSGIEVFPYRRPQVWDPDVLPAWRRWAGLHVQLLPYLRGAVEEYRRTGVPVMRACGLVWPDLPALVDVDDQYLLGPDLLVAPALAPGVTTRPVVVPPGRWVELWSAVDHDPVTRELTLRRGGGRVLDGGGTGRPEVLDAPLEWIPVLVRAGARLDLLDPGVVSLAAFDRDPPVARSLQF